MTRKFIISEGLFSYYGDIAPLPKMVREKLLGNHFLKKKKWRFLVPE